MLYNKNKLPRYVETAGKATIVTALSALTVFLFAFIINFGKAELQRVEAQSSGTATTTLTVLNTPPQWVAGLEGQEEFESSTTTPTNSSYNVSWVGTASDANGAPYFMIICSNNATPTAGYSTTTLGTVPPTCNGGTQWGVSTSTLSGSRARVATTTTETSPFSESNTWYAWVCDDDPALPRCSSTYSQGVSATNTSPFHVNRRPVFSDFSNSSPTNPGQTVTFYSTSTDPDVADDDLLYLVVCSANTFSTTTLQCGPGDKIASTTIGSFVNATTATSLPAIIQDTSYNAYGFIYDQHGHVATGGSQGSNVPFTVSNVAPTVLGGDIDLNLGSNLVLTVPGGETTGFTLDFEIADANSCDAFGGGAADEVTGYVASVFRSGVGSTTCDGSALSHDEESCYASGVGTARWNLACTASTTSCTGSTDDTILFNCSFPLWFIADPTDGTITDTPFYNQKWAAGVAGVDDDNATGTMATTSIDVELISLVAIDMLNSQIAYSDLEPGTQMTNLTSSSSLRVLGNTGLNQILGGDSMCGTYSPNNPCSVSATSTIPQDQQRYGTSSVAFASGAILQPTSTPATLLIEIPKPTSTSTPTIGVTYWGIAVPASITLAGSYTGQNTFTGESSEPGAW